MENCSLGNICPRDRRNIWKQSVSYMNSRSTCAITVPTACLTLVERFREHESHYLSRILPWLWQARSFGAKRQQAETLTSPRLLLDGAFPIPPCNTDFICGCAMCHRYFSSRCRSVVCRFCSSSPSRQAAFALWISSSRICSCARWYSA